MWDLNALTEFLAVARAGSFAGAARALGLPKSTVSKRIQDLETSLNTRLFERSSRALRLTEEGMVLLSRAERIVQEATDAEALLRKRDQEPIGRLRISVPHLFGQVFAGHIVASYRRQFPLVSLELRFSDRAVDLISEGFDAAIRIGTLSDSSLVARTIANERNILVAAPKLFANAALPTHPDELLRWPCLAFRASAQGEAVWPLRKENLAVEVALKPVAVVESLLALRDAARMGAGIAYLPAFIVREDLLAGSLVTVLDGWEGDAVPISVVYASSRSATPRLRQFIELLLEMFPARALPTPTR